MVRFYLDGIEVTSPVNWQEFSLKLAKDKTIDAILLTSDTSLQWADDGYSYLNGLIESGGFCTSVDLLVKDDEPIDQVVFYGRVFLSSSEIDESLCTIKSRVEDRSFYAMINSNKGIEADMTAEVSKNGTAIPAVDMYVLDVHDVVGGAFVDSIYSVRVFDAFRYLTDFMTDDTIGFVSDTFDIGGEWEGLTITSGNKLRRATGYTGDTPPLPLFSFRKLYEEVKKKIPIGITVDESAGSFTLRIESIDYFNLNTSGTMIFENIEAIKTKFIEEKLYASVRVGSDTIDDTLTFPESQPIIGYKEEQLFNDINCNVDNELNLVSQWIISSNVIEDCVTGVSSEYDEDLFFITSTLITPTLGVSTQTDIFNSGTDYFYNDLLRNINVLERYGTGIPQSALQYFNGSPSNFYAFKSVTQQHLRSVTVSNTGMAVIININGINGQIDDESTPPASDPNNVFQASQNIPPVSTNVFTAPVDAYYSFEAGMDMDIIGSVSGSGIGFINPTNTDIVTVVLKYDTYTGGGVLVDSDVVVGNVVSGKYSHNYTASNPSPGPYTVTPYTQPLVFGKYLPSGWRLTLKVVITFGTYNAITSGSIGINEKVYMRQGSYFTCTGNSTDNPGITAGNLNEYIAYEHAFTYPLTSSEFNYIRANSRELYRFSMAGRTERMGWISDLKYNWVTGMATVKLESNQLNNNG